MTKIRVLPEILANKIAAGEIVERPASVAKELIENSLDAGAGSIAVTVESGGKKLIQVQDDGEGMSGDDALLAFEHHATSKIRTADDLGAIASLGFRGEALPSIASISRLILQTRRAGGTEAAGTEVQIQGGTVRSVKPISWDSGTLVTVRDLFFNVPARRKFLRSRETELAHISRLVTHYALARPQVRLTLSSDGRQLLDAVRCSSLRERVYQVFGEGFLTNLVELSGSSGRVEITGFASQPHEQRTNPYHQFFYVNGRMVRDRVIMSAVRQAYRHAIPGSAYPVVLIFITLPFDQVDVNAHPAKTEIRFRDQGFVHDLVRETLQRCLVGCMTIPAYRRLEVSRTNLPDAPDLPSGASSWAPAGTSPLLDFSSRVPNRDLLQSVFGNSPRPVLPVVPGENHRSLALRPECLLEGADEGPSPFSLRGSRILGQIKESYIVAADSAGLLIIDQHVAHERVLYEKNAVAVQQRQVQSQGLLTPITLELTPDRQAVLETSLAELTASGFHIEPFGGNTVLVRAVPTLAKDDDCRALLLEILEGLEKEERTLDVARILDKIAVGMACRAAIKVNMPLTLEKMQWLLDELAQTRVPTNCPHGRPIILRFSTYEIERNFGRI